MARYKSHPAKQHADYSQNNKHMRGRHILMANIMTCGPHARGDACQLVDILDLRCIDKVNQPLGDCRHGRKAFDQLDEDV